LVRWLVNHNLSIQLAKPAILDSKLEDSVGKQKRSLEFDFTSVAVSVTQRKEPPLSPMIHGCHAPSSGTIVVINLPVTVTYENVSASYTVLVVSKATLDSMKKTSNDK
jgi:hypothetical protein